MVQHPPPRGPEEAAAPAAPPATSRHLRLSSSLLLRASPRLTFSFVIPFPPVPLSLSHNLLKTFPPLQEPDFSFSLPLALPPLPSPGLAVQV